MESNVVIAYFIGIIVLLIIGKIFIIPIKLLLKLLLNSALGGAIIFVINLIGTNLNFHVGLNFITALFIGLLGAPSCILIILVKLLVG